jgi:hypothetical protein
VKKSEKFLIAAAINGLIAVFLMLWSLVDPRPLPVLVAMSAGQVLGTISLAAYLMVVAADVRRKLRARSLPPPPPSSRHHL